jgi:hypothetical protein
VATVFTRVNASNLEDLPQSTPERGLPVLGELPADYLLAAGDEYSLKGEEPRDPHDTYLGAVNRLAHSLVQMAQIVSTAPVASPQPSRAQSDAPGPASQ